MYLLDLTIEALVARAISERLVVIASILMGLGGIAACLVFVVF